MFVGGSPVSATYVDDFLDRLALQAPANHLFDYDATPGNTHFDTARSAAALNSITALIANGGVRTGVYA